MSGGSYNYLYSKEVEDMIIVEETYEWLLEMLKDIQKLDFVNEPKRDRVMKEMLNFITDLESIKDKINLLSKEKDKFVGVWRAMEMWQSNDGGKKEVIKSINEFKGGGYED